MSDARILNILSRCGLNSSESAIFADLLNRGESSAGAIAKRCAMNRTTVYSALQLLEERGFLKRRRSSSATRFALLDPAQLLRAVRNDWQRRHEMVQDATRALEDVLREYPHSDARHIGGYEIVSYESRRKTEEFFKKVLHGGHYDSLFDIESFTDTKWRRLMLNLLEHTAKTRPPIREIIIATSDPSWYVNKIRNPNHKVKLLKSLGPLLCEFAITNDAVILNSYESCVEISLQIKHIGYRSTMSRVFEVLWQSAEAI